MTSDRRSWKLGELVARIPAAARVLESHRIDYCCGGDRTLEQACQDEQLDPDSVLEAIDTAQREEETRQSAGSVNWLERPLAELCDHIEQTHHAYLKQELPRLTELVTKVVAAHSSEHPELHDVQRLFGALRAELEPHLMKEERILFPAVRMLEQSELPPAFPFGSVANPIGVMEHEHDQAGNLLKQLRQVTGDYRVPEDGCSAYEALYQGLQTLEQDLHQHIHKENNILFPRAKQAESGA